MTKSNDELKACPFCGGEATDDYSDIDGGRYDVHCHKCNGCFSADNIHDAIKGWNTRTTSVCLEKTVPEEFDALCDAATDGHTYTNPENGEVWHCTSGTADGDAEALEEFNAMIVPCSNLEDNYDTFTFDHTCSRKTVEAIRKALQSMRESSIEPIKIENYDVIREFCEENLDKKTCNKLNEKPPVDTIAVPREVLMGVRDAAQEIIDGALFPRKFATKILTSLDAVLAEGES